MKKLLVFLHGKGANKEAHYELIDKIADGLDCDVLRFNAPLKSSQHPDGFKWFDKEEVDGQPQMIVKEFNLSVDFIVEQIETELKKRSQTFDDVILCGHSQGGLMSCYLGLILGPQKVISLCGDFPRYLDFEVPINKDVPIMWVEAGKDTFLNQDRKSSYEVLQKLGCSIDYYLSPESTHNRLCGDIVDFILRKK